MYRDASHCIAAAKVSKRELFHGQAGAGKSRPTPSATYGFMIDRLREARAMGARIEEGTMSDVWAIKMKAKVVIGKQNTQRICKMCRGEGCVSAETRRDVDRFRS